MEYCYKQHKIRKYLRRNRENMEESIVTISNVNGFSVEKHMKMLNLNDDVYEYIKYLGDVEV